MPTANASVDKRFAAVVDKLKGSPGVSIGSTTAKKGFGSSALRIHDRIFAMVSSKGQFVVKLPSDRVDALSKSGAGENFDPGHGRLMKEWLALKPQARADWLALAREAMVFVGRNNS